MLMLWIFQRICNKSVFLLFFQQSILISIYLLKNKLLWIIVVYFSDWREWLKVKAMRNLEIYAITCYAEFQTSGIPTVGNLTKINSISENPELRRNLTEILGELRNCRY